MTTTTSPVPSRVSNGRLIEQMLLWGWTIEKRHGEMVLMKHPVMRRKIDVRAATYHKGNTTSTIRDVYALTTDSDASRFWARSEPITAPAEATIVSNRPIGPEPPAIEPTYPGRSPEHEAMDRSFSPVEPEPEKAQRVVKNRGITNKVFESMLRNQAKPMSGRQLAVLLGYDQTPVANALTYLHSRDLLERVKTGFYQLPAALRTEDVRVVHRIVAELNDGLPLEHVRTIMAAPLPAEPAPEPPEPVPPVMVGKLTGDTYRDPDPDPRDRDAAPMDPADVDDLIDTVLDMMFPDGFKARHRRTVDAWAEATRKLIVEVGT